MNCYEQDLIKQWVRCNYIPETPFQFENAPLCRPLFHAIIHDVEGMLPPGTVDRLDVIAEYSQRFGEDDGLLYQTYQPWLKGAEFLRPVYLNGLTTIWIANFTRLQKEDRRVNKTKRQRKFQQALLYYCFNYFVGGISTKDALHFEWKIEKTYSRYEWMSSKTDEVQAARFRFAFEMMHYYGLEYRNPSLPC